MSMDSQWEEARREMVETIRRHGVRDERVLAAMARVPRHRFIPERFRDAPVTAYGDHPCPIGERQTISQPFIVAHMTEALGLKDGQTVLEVGCGSGYQAAVLAELGARVYSVERISELAQRARTTLDDLGYDAVRIRIGNGAEGWPEHAPYDAIVVACATPSIPRALLEQLADGGALMLPEGDAVQRLVLLLRHGASWERRTGLEVRFVPLIDTAAD